MHLTSIPAELFLYILNNLSFSDVQALRSSCKLLRSILSYRSIWTDYLKRNYAHMDWTPFCFRLDVPSRLSDILELPTNKLAALIVEERRVEAAWLHYQNRRVDVSSGKHLNVGYLMSCEPALDEQMHLLPGGKWLLYASHGVVSLYDLGNLASERPEPVLQLTSLTHTAMVDNDDDCHRMLWHSSYPNLLTVGYKTTVRHSDSEFETKFDIWRIHLGEIVEKHLATVTIGRNCPYAWTSLTHSSLLSVYQEEISTHTNGYVSSIKTYAEIIEFDSPLHSRKVQLTHVNKTRMQIVVLVGHNVYCIYDIWAAVYCLESVFDSNPALPITMNGGTPASPIPVVSPDVSSILADVWNSSALNSIFTVHKTEYEQCHRIKLEGPVKYSAFGVVFIEFTPASANSCCRLSIGLLEVEGDRGLPFVPVQTHVPPPIVNFSSDWGSASNQSDQSSGSGPNAAVIARSRSKRIAATGDESRKIYMHSTRLPLPSYPNDPLFYSQVVDLKPAKCLGVRLCSFPETYFLHATTKPMLAIDGSDGAGTSAHSHSQTVHWPKRSSAYYKNSYPAHKKIFFNSSRSAPKPHMIVGDGISGVMCIFEREFVGDFEEPVSTDDGSRKRKRKGKGKGKRREQLRNGRTRMFVVDLIGSLSPD